MTSSAGHNTFVQRLSTVVWPPARIPRSRAVRVFTTYRSMAKHPSSRRRHTPEEPEDAFVNSMVEVGAWVKAHARFVIAVTSVAVLAAGGTAYYFRYQKTLESRAATRLTELQQEVAGGNQTLAIRDLQTFVSRFGNTPSAQEARLMLARLELQTGQTADAMDLVRDLAQNLDAPLGVNAALLLAAGYEQQGKFDEAEKIYLNVGNNARFDYQHRNALENAAMLRLEHGNPQGAASLFQEIVDGMKDNDPQRGYYEMLLAEARADTQAAPDTTSQNG
ncbi:MAG: tetratricopeptide repeat protein [Gemmatimonadota bacterium]